MRPNPLMATLTDIGVEFEAAKLRELDARPKTRDGRLPQNGLVDESYNVIDVTEVCIGLSALRNNY